MSSKPEIHAGRLAALVEESGVSKRAVSLDAFGNPDGVRFVLSGQQKTTSYTKTRRLARRLGVSVDYLTGQSSERGEPPTGGDVDDITPLNLSADLREVADIAANPEMIPVSEYDEGGEVLRTHYIDAIDARRLGAKGDLAAVPVVGDAMAPTMQANDIALLDAGARNIAQAAIYAFVERGAVICRRLELDRETAGRVSVSAVNGSYSSYSVAVDELEILGRVLAFTRKI